MSDVSLPLLPAVRFQGPGSVEPQINAWQVDALLSMSSGGDSTSPDNLGKAGPFSLKQPRRMSASEFLDRSRPSIGLSDVLNPPVSFSSGKEGAGAHVGLGGGVTTSSFQGREIG